MITLSAAVGNAVAGPPNPTSYQLTSSSQIGAPWLCQINILPDATAARHSINIGTIHIIFFMASSPVYKECFVFLL
jgi:hypothetical protein